MSWFDDRYAEAKELSERAKLIAEHRGAIYESLWEQIKQVVEEARKKGYQLVTNGNPEDRIVRLSIDPLSGRRTELRIKLSRSEPKITASGGGVDLEFAVEVGEDSFVCLKHAGKPVSSEHAARLIMDPFLFPQLQRE